MVVAKLSYAVAGGISEGIKVYIPFPRMLSGWALPRVDHILGWVAESIAIFRIL
jgi:hypothetical protein